MTQDGTLARTRLDGVVIGLLLGFAEGGEPLVVFAGNASETAIAARSTAALGRDDVGAEVALLFEGGDPGRPVIVGRLLRPEPELPPVTVEQDGERVEITAAREIVLRCGEASITLTRAGKVLIRGTHILSRSSGANRIKGASVQLN